MTATRNPAADRRSDRTPRPAPALRRILSHAGLETRVLLSNGEQLTVAVALPAMVLIGLWLLPLGRLEGVSAVDTAVAATFATALISTSFTSQAIITGFDRRNGVLRWVATTPLGRDGYLAGKILATLTMHVLQVVVLGLIAVLIGWRPERARAARDSPRLAARHRRLRCARACSSPGCSAQRRCSPSRTSSSSCSSPPEASPSRPTCIPGSCTVSWTCCPPARSASCSEPVSPAEVFSLGPRRGAPRLGCRGCLAVIALVPLDLGRAARLIRSPGRIRPVQCERVAAHVNLRAEFLNS